MPIDANVRQLLERLDAAHRAHIRVTAEALYELRTPVTTMLGELDVALRSDRRGAYRELCLVFDPPWW